MRQLKYGIEINQTVFNHTTQKKHSSKKQKKTLDTNYNSAIDHSRSQPHFITASTQVDLWDRDRDAPIQSYSWGADTITTCSYNKTETSIFASCGGDRTIILYDTRTAKPISKVILEMRSNALAWNPMEAFNFSVVNKNPNYVFFIWFQANEDHNSYTFDMRNLSIAKNILKDHVSAVLDINYSPTGQEIVTGSYDKTIRIFNVNQGHSRDAYHLKRMQR